jgi:hypothetical protein
MVLSWQDASSCMCQVDLPVDSWAEATDFSAATLLAKSLIIPRAKKFPVSIPYY